MNRTKIDAASLFHKKNTESTKPKASILPSVGFLDKEEKSVIRTQALDLDIDPAVLRPWKLHDRDQSQLNEEDCADIIESIKAIGQKDAIKVRALENDPDGYLYEIIKGRRRSFACGILGRKVRARAEDMSNQDAWLEMDSENDDRKDISEMERAKSYAAALEADLFESPAQLALCRGKDKTHVSKYLSAERLLHHADIGPLLVDYTAVAISPANRLMAILRKDEAAAKAVIECAKSLKGKNFKSVEVLKKLEAAGKTAKAKKTPSNNATHTVKKGDHVIITAKRVNDKSANVELDLENAKAADLMKGFRETLKKLGIK